MVARVNDTVTLDGASIPYRIRTSRRAKRMRLVVRPDDSGAAQVELVLPVGAPPDRIAAFVASKRAWIFAAVHEVEARQTHEVTQRWVDGAPLQLRGQWLTLRVGPADVAAVRIRCEEQVDVQVPRDLAPSLWPEKVQHACERWMRGLALRDVERLGAAYAARLGVTPAGYRLTDAKRRWGSCSASDVIRVHWRLVQAPLAALEYVVAHEITHLVHRHHQPPFWATLAQIMPDWADRKAALSSWERAPRVR